MNVRTMDFIFSALNTFYQKENIPEDAAKKALESTKISVFRVRNMESKVRTFMMKYLHLVLIYILMDVSSYL